MEMTISNILRDKSFVERLEIVEAEAVEMNSTVIPGMSANT
jgi:hypothetical protein